MKKYNYTWLQFDKDVKDLVKKITSDPDFVVTGVYGIPRGGLVPTVMLSHYLRVPIVPKAEINSTTLVVDDVSDTGITLEEHFQSFKRRKVNPHTMTLFIKPETKFVPTFYARKTKKWIVFPWETKFSSIK